MSTLIKRIEGKFLLQIVFDYVPLNKLLKIVKYNKKLLSIVKTDDVKYIKDFISLKKFIKPIANCEDYLPILKRIYKHNSKTNYAFELFIDYFKKNNSFIPQINKINENEELLNSLHSFKIGFNRDFINNFYNSNNVFEFEKLMKFCDKYGRKIKEITFMDNNVPSLDEKKECLFILKYIIKSSKVERFEDRCFGNDKSLLLKIYDLDYNEDVYEQIYIDKFNQKTKFRDIVDIINGLKFYSLYFIDNSNCNHIVKSFNDIILLNAKNLEELKITKINKDNSAHFANLLKKLNNLKALSITSTSDDDLLFNDISNSLNANSLTKLEMNLHYFDECINIINKNVNSLKELTIKIKGKKEEGSKIIQTVSNLNNLQKLKIIAKISLLNPDNIKNLSFKNLKYLEMPLFIKNYIFDLNTFFEKCPKLKGIKLNGINFNKNNEIKEKNINIINNIKLNVNLVEKLKKIEISNCQKNGSFFIPKIFQLLSYEKIKDNIKEIKLENCEFDNNIDINILMKSISYYDKIESLQLNNISFQKGQSFFFDRMDNFKYLNNFYFKGLNCEQNNIHLLSFLSHLSEKCKYLIEIELPNQNLNSDDMNLILKKLTNFHFLTKVSLFDNYTMSGFFAYRNKCNMSTIDFKQSNNHYMIDIRNMNIKKNIKNITTSSYYSPKIFFVDDFNDNKNRTYSNEIEKYYSYESILLNNFHTKVMHYFIQEKQFVIDEFVYN